MNTHIVAGIDIGSLSAEAVILGGNRVLGYSVINTGADSRRAAEESLALALKRAECSPGDIAFTVATGYGRVNVPFADLQVTEITCHARGAVFLLPGTRTVIDIGGQDSKVIRLDDMGTVVDFAMNDKCAAGTGRFLEVMARALETRVDALSDLAASARRAAPISSMCTVFAESEVVSLVGQGTPREEIVRGLLQSVAERTVNMVHRVGLAREVAMTGGVAKNRGVVRAIAERLGVPVNVPPEPQIVGALGAALIARSRAR
ncbi:MAG: acyl-CoA dehydratase activase [Thermoanaerobacterales bacterium]|nr:acyl-CoA dehydratase activase [Bacillota bacterium]MDI6906658.1 acyl-CoA dehydratase activase [Thermoanaerobacterales bacterium]